jgi:P27 family predicted phage terminase small subunit
MEPVKQRGRKPRASLSVIGGPRLVVSQPTDHRPPPPDYLGAPERQIWADVVADWKGSRSSFSVLASGLESHQRAREARETIDEEGLTIIGRDGQPKAHPLCSVERDARAAFQRTFKQLGIKL